MSLVCDGLAAGLQARDISRRTESHCCFCVQLRRLDNSHPHIIHTHGMLRGASGSVYIMQERAVCDLHDAAGACSGRVMGEGEHVKEWMLQVAHGTYT